MFSDPRMSFEIKLYKNPSSTDEIDYIIMVSLVPDPR